MAPDRPSLVRPTRLCRGALAAGLAAATLAGPARAGGVVGDGVGRRVEQETMLVVWDHERQVEHLVLAARAAGLTAGAYVAAVPAGAQLDQPVDGVAAAITALLPRAAPLASPGGDEALLLPRPDGLTGHCKQRKLSCDAPALAWAAERLEGPQEVVLLPVAPTEGAGTTPYAHLRFDAPRPLVPFAEATSETIEPDPPPVDAEHPPQVRLWLELFNESPAGRWERQMDDAVEARAPELAACYAQELARKRRLAGSVHVQLRIGPDQLVTVEEERPEPAALAATTRCFATALTRPPWPRQGFGKAIRLEVHASVRPPAATTRRLLAVVLSSRDVEPRLGRGDDPRVVPELRPLASLEPEPGALAAAFPAPLRQALGLDLSRRWRLVAFETGADPRPLRDDIELRPLALPAPRPGETPAPVIARGDRPEGAVTPAPPVRWWRRRAARWSAGGALVLALIALVLWRERR